MQSRNMTPRTLVAFLSGATLLATAAHAAETTLAERRDAQAFAITDENDYWGYWSDKYYTNATRFAWTSPDWYSSGDDGVVRRLTLSVTQEMYTPKNTVTTAPLPGDHPYAGVAYVGAGFSWETERTLDSLEIDFGVVGPGALAQKTQRSWHIFLKDQIPNGWDSQLHDEPLLNIAYERRWRFLLAGEPTGWGVDILPRVVGLAGTMRTEAVAGAQLRFGLNLPRDFGRSTLRQNTAYVAPHAERDFSLYGFLDLQAEAVAWNVALDGNVWHDSYSVGSRTFVGQFSAGIGMRWSRFNVSLVQTVRTEEFRSQDHVFVFGGVVASVDF